MRAIASPRASSGSASVHTPFDGGLRKQHHCEDCGKLIRHFWDIEFGLTVCRDCNWKRHEKQNVSNDGRL